MEKSTKNPISEKQQETQKKRAADVKKLRAKYQHDKKNKIIGRNMEFLAIILKKLKINQREFEKRTGTSQQMLNWWFVSDDAFYCNVTQAFKNMGYELSAHFEGTQDDELKRQYKICGIINIDPDTEPVAKTKIEDHTLFKNNLLVKSIESDNEFAVLARLIHLKLKMTLREFCIKYDENYDSLYRMLKRNRLRISKMYEISRKTNSKIVWNLNKTEIKKTEQ